MAQSNPSEPLFTEPSPERSFPVAAIAIAAVALVILTTVFVLLSRRHVDTDQNSAYVSAVQLTDVQMSESESLSGGKSTYLDGHITNRGPLTVTGATARVSFPTDSGGAPQVLTAPIQLIRAREPYIDVQPLAVAPLAPGATAEFRLIFEGVSDAWNQQEPSITVTGTSTR